MFNLIKRVFTGCDHKWKTLYTLSKHRNSDAKMVGVQYHLKCEKCGTIKIKDTRI